MISEYKFKVNDGIINFFRDISTGYIPLETGNLIKDNLNQLCNEKAEEIQDENNFIEHVFGLKIKNAKNVYVPNVYSSSVFLIRSIFSTFKKYKTNYKSVLELGTGTGVIGLSLYNHNQLDKLYLTDISEQSVNCCQDNVNENFPYSKNIKVVKSNLFNSEELSGVKFDCIIFNLPLCHFQTFDSRNDISLTDLDGKIVTQFFDEVSKYLNKDGEIWFTYSNISYPSILKNLFSKFKFELILSEYQSSSGLIIFSYRAKILN